MVSLEGLDKGTLYWFHTQFRPQTPWLEPVMQGATFLADRLTLYVVGLVGVAALLARRRDRSAGYFALAFLGGETLSEALKGLVRRPRPEVLSRLPSGYSFPSSHALMGTVLYLSLALLILPALRTQALRVALILGALVVVFLIGFSRMYFCVHYLSDVAGGWGLGLAWTLICHRLAQDAKSVGKKRGQDP
jgi:undecaprenyl-diphosphatase